MNIRYWLLTTELEQMSKFLDFAGGALEQTAQEFEREVVQMAERIPEDQRESFLEYHADEYAMLRDDFPRTLFTSFLVSWYSFVEEKLKRLCDELVPLSELDEEQRRKLGRGIVRSRKILSKAKRYKIRQEHWEELKRIQKIRNKAVHVGGKLGSLESEADIAKYLERHSLIAYRGVVILDPSLAYCKHLVNFGKDLFSTIYNDLNLR